MVCGLGLKVCPGGVRVSAYALEGWDFAGFRVNPKPEFLDPIDPTPETLDPKPEPLNPIHVASKSKSKVSVRVDLLADLCSVSGERINEHARSDKEPVYL